MRTPRIPIDIPISSLDLSPEFKAMAQVNHFSTLSQMLEIPVGILPELPLFSYRILAEYLSVLSEYGLEDQIEND